MEKDSRFAVFGGPWPNPSSGGREGAPIKTIPKKKKYKKAKWLSEEALQISVKRREAKSKGEKERYKIGRAHV